MDSLELIQSITVDRSYLEVITKAALGCFYLSHDVMDRSTQKSL